jgi:hypothetical protein
METSTIVVNLFLFLFPHMPTLVQSLQSHDIGFLRLVARLWGIDSFSSDKKKILVEIADAILDHAVFLETIDSLSAEAKSAYKALANNKGKLLWATFTRQFGVIREAGPGKRDREQIYLNPVSVAEILFYRGLIGKAFYDTPVGAQEFAYIPSNILSFLKVDELPQLPPSDVSETHGKKNYTNKKMSAKAGSMDVFGRLASPKERAHPLPVSDRLLDDATTLLAALRMGLPLPVTPIPAFIVFHFLETAKIILPSSKVEEIGEGIPDIEAVRHFLETSRENALEFLYTKWLESDSFNELHQLPGLVCDGEWENQPAVTRKYLLTLLKAIPENRWWSLEAFILAIKNKNPDFQRPAGDYDSWFIKRESDGAYLRGFANWNEVDGALIKYMITGPLNWLGMVELATPMGSDVISAFRRIKSDLHDRFDMTRGLHVSSQGKIVIPRSISRLSRYQIARFCEWDLEKDNEYHYWVSPNSLIKAAAHGLKVKQLLSLLARNAASEIPPSFIKALNRWENKGTEARMVVHTILKVSRPEVLDELRKSKAGRFFGETLGPVTVTIKAGAQPKVLAALAEMGLLGEEVKED